MPTFFRLQLFCAVSLFCEPFPVILTPGTSLRNRRFFFVFFFSFYILQVRVGCPQTFSQKIVARANENDKPRDMTANARGWGWGKRKRKIFGEKNIKRLWTDLR